MFRASHPKKTPSDLLFLSARPLLLSLLLDELLQICQRHGAERRRESSDWFFLLGLLVAAVSVGGSGTRNSSGGSTKV